jgi:hypothetical protein
VYRYENSKKYYATLTQAAHLAHYNRLHGVKIELKDPQMMVTVEHQDKEKAKGVLSWVPVTFKPTGVKKIVSAFTGDEEAEVFQIKSCPDKWSFHFNPEVDVKGIPHYATINLEGSTRPEIKLQITVQGRRPPCSICDDDGHWSTHCPSKRTWGKQNEKAAEPFPTLRNLPAASASVARAEKETVAEADKEDPPQVAQDPPQVAQDPPSSGEVEGTSSSFWSLTTPRRSKPEVPKLTIKRVKPNKATPTKRRGGPPPASEKDDPFFVEAAPQKPSFLWADLVSPQSDELCIALTDDDGTDEGKMNS